MINSIAIVGCGTIGSVLSMRLAEEHIVSTLKIYDFDHVTGDSYPFKETQRGLLKIDIIQFLCNKINPYMVVDVHNQKVLTPGIESQFIIDCRDDKNTNIGSDIRISLDGFRLFIDAKDNKDCIKSYHKYVFPRDPYSIEKAIKIVIEYLKNGIYIFKDIRFYNLKNDSVVIF